MALALHRAIQDALEGADYQERSILTSHVLEATHALEADADTLYRCVHTFFAELPRRLVPRSVFLVTTSDVDDGVELTWESRELPRDDYRPGDGIHSAYADDGPLAQALRDLEQYCNLRAGYVRTTFERVQNSSSFHRPDHVHRRVLARLPFSRALADLRQREADVKSEAPYASLRGSAEGDEQARRRLDPIQGLAQTPKRVLLGPIAASRRA